MLRATGGKMPTESTYQDLLVHSMTTEYITKDVFQILIRHSLDSSLEEENHRKQLISSIVLCYSIMRMHSIAKKHTETIQGDYIRKTLSKLILFNNQ